MKDKVVIITGAGSGIGREAALKFAKNDAKVIVSDLNEEHGIQVKNEIEQSGGIAVFVHTDISKPEDGQRLVDEAVKQFGRLDCAVNNAGISSLGVGTADYTIEHWDKVIAVNLSGVFYGMKPQINQMLKNGGGAIVNTSSVLGVSAIFGSVAYVAAKHGVIGLTKTAAVEYAQKNIRVNAVGPGYTDTPLLGHYDKARKEGVINRHPIGRLAQPIEIANMIYWLCTDEASFATGAYYPVDGGYTAQ